MYSKTYLLRKFVMIQIRLERISQLSGIIHFYKQT